MRGAKGRGIRCIDIFLYIFPFINRILRITIIPEQARTKPATADISAQSEIRSAGSMNIDRAGCSHPAQTRKKGIRNYGKQ